MQNLHNIILKVQRHNKGLDEIVADLETYREESKTPTLDTIKELVFNRAAQIARKIKDDTATPEEKAEWDILQKIIDNVPFTIETRQTRQIPPDICGLSV